MDHDAEFAACAEESWGTLVRSAVFLGFSEYLHPLGRHWMVGMGQGRGVDF